jgi:hypothetical protein
MSQKGEKKKSKSELRKDVERRERAAVRKAERAKRSPAEQLAKLDAAFGVGQGAKKERARLAAVKS